MSEFNWEWFEEEEIELCDYTGEECIGDKMFCEECPVMTGEWDDD